MKLLLLSGMCVLALARAAFGTSDFYINNGIVSVVSPPQAAPQIDAYNFVNNGYFAITNAYTDTFSPPLPYETWNTVNYSNRNRMLGDSGFRFGTHDGGRRPAVNFVNANTVNETNASIYGAAYVLVSATNIINRGTLAVGGPGQINLTGRNVDLSRGQLAAVGNETNDLAGVLDWYWGIGTNLFSGYVDPRSFFSPVISQTIEDGMYGYYGQAFQLIQGFDTYVRIAQVSAVERIVDVLFLSQTNRSISTEVRFAQFPGLRGSQKVVQWQSAVTNRVTGSVVTNRLYLSDTLNFYGEPFPEPPAAWLVQTLRPNFYYTLFSAATFHPINYRITHAYPNYANLALMTPVAFDDTIFSGTNFPVFVTNTAYGARLTAQPFSVDPTISGSTYNNVPGRVEVTADHVLDLTRTRLNGESYMLLRATNHFIGSTNAEIVSPFSDISLASTNGQMTVANLLTPTVPAIAGDIEVWSGRWVNFDTVGMMSRYSVTIIDSRLVGETPAQVQDLTLRSTNLVVSDRLNIFRELLLDTERLTISSNAPTAPTPVGEINLTSGELWWSPSVPRMQHLTNYGRITSVNSIFFAGARRPPFFTGTFDEPYQSFVNHGTVISEGNETWAAYYEAGGTNNSGIGPLTIRATEAHLANGALIASNSDISIQSSVLQVSNQLIRAGRSLTLTVSDYLDDGSLTNSLETVTNKNGWTVADGFNLLVRPQVGSLLATTVNSTSPVFADVISQWAGEDRGCANDGYTNNAALGRLILDGGDRSRFTFVGTATSNAIYLDYLEFRNYATNRNEDGNFYGIHIATNMTVYFAQAMMNGISIAEKLHEKYGSEGASGGRFCWVSSYAGFYSSTNLVYPDGTTNAFNAALVASCNLDSDDDGLVNCSDPTPIRRPQDVGLTVAVVAGASPRALVTWQAQPFASYELVYKDSMAATNWQTLTNVVQGASRGPVTVADPLRQTSPRFYRVRVDVSKQ